MAIKDFAVRHFKPQHEIFSDSEEARRFNLLYFAMLVFACLIALAGLLLNSPAVIIGAMLISPLMGPILACGLALTTANWDIGRNAVRNVLLSIAETVVIAAGATYLSPLQALTPEILARTNPNLVDLLIAFFSGLAGTLAMNSKKAGMTILPGVAIATATMPPLATVGYGISTHQWEIARGASMLFITNATAIVLSASLVYFLVGFQPRRLKSDFPHPTLVRWRIPIATMIVCALGVPLMRTLLQAADQARIHKTVEHELRSSFASGRTRLDSFDIRPAAHQVDVTANVETAEYIDPTQIHRVRSQLEKSIGRPIDLQINQLQLAQKPQPQTPAPDFVAGGAVKQMNVTSVEPQAIDEEIAAVQEKIKSELEPLVTSAGATAIQVSAVGVTPEKVIRLDISADEENASEPIWTVAAAALARTLKASISMNVAVRTAAIELSYARGQTCLTARQMHQLKSWKSKFAPATTTFTVESHAVLTGNSFDECITSLAKQLPLSRNSARSSLSNDPDRITITAITHFTVQSGKPGGA